MDEGVEGMAEGAVREDANEVLNASVTYAKRMLRKYGQFGPFAYRMKEDGDVALEVVAQHDMPAEPTMLMDLLYQQLGERAKKGLLLAAAVASNVTMGKASKEGHMDAVMVELEHKDGYCMRAFVPYRITGGQLHGFFPRVVRFGALLTQEGAPRLFGRE
ncbi:MAG: hypothetical protein WAM66_14730 [Acidobacteriaceae bacterium]